WRQVLSQLWESHLSLQPGHAGPDQTQADAQGDQRHCSCCALVGKREAELVCHSGRHRSARETTVSTTTRTRRNCMESYRPIARWSLCLAVADLLAGCGPETADTTSAEPMTDATQPSDPTLRRIAQ